MSEDRGKWLALIVATLIALMCGGATWYWVTGEEGPPAPPDQPPAVTATTGPEAPAHTTPGTPTVAPAVPSPSSEQPGISVPG